MATYDARVPESFAEMLKGGHPNSLGRTEEVVGVVLAERARLEELFATMAEPDEVVRLRVGDALEKVCRKQPGGHGNGEGDALGRDRGLITIGGSCTPN